MKADGFKAALGIGEVFDDDFAGIGPEHPDDKNVFFHRVHAENRKGVAVVSAEECAEIAVVESSLIHRDAWESILRRFAGEPWDNWTLANRFIPAGRACERGIFLQEC